MTKTVAPPPAESDFSDEKKIARWVEANVGGTVTSVVKLRRWRPVWRVDIAENGLQRSVLAKGNRPWESIPFSLWHEMRLNQILEDHGIKVPHVYGMVDGVEAFVMDWIDGGRDAGLVQQSIEFGSTMSADRWQASLKYMDVLAKIHAIPVSAFADTEAGNPQGAAALALDQYERNYQLLVKRDGVDAMIEFFTLWLRRNYPANRTDRAFVTGDCGQFLSIGAEIAAVLDVEIGHIGDPMHDLACFRGRHPVENMGDLPALFRRYEQASGKPLDIPAIAYHTVSFLALATIGPMLAHIEKHRGGDWLEALMQLAFIGRRTCDAMAEIIGVTFEPITLPDFGHVSRHAELALEKLQSEIAALPPSADLADWQKAVLLSLPDYLRNHLRYGHWQETEDLNDIAEMIGEPVNDLVSADAKLKTFVQAAGPEQDKSLLILFQRRLMRLCLLIAGKDAPADHLLFMPVEPIFDKKLG